MERFAFARVRLFIGAHSFILLKGGIADGQIKEAER
nr:MAG TPA: hypothetical protein [Caudoviricetes sp.]